MRNELLIDRRTLLRGAGAALALPLLETMGWAEGRTGRPPVRMAFMYMPHGVIPERFWPEKPETFLTLPAEQVIGGHRKSPSRVPVGEATIRQLSYLCRASLR